MVKFGSLFKSSFAFTIINTINKIIRFFSFLIIARYLEPEGFGTYSIVIATIEIFRVISDFGIDTILVKRISENLDKENEYIKQAFHLKFLLNTIVMAAGYGSVLFIYYSNPQIIIGVLILSFGSFFFSFSNSLKAKFQARLLVNKTILPITVLNVFYLALIYISTKLIYSMEILFILQTLVDLFTFVWLLKLSNIGSFITRFSTRVYLHFLRDCFPLAIASGIIVVYSRVTIYFLSFFANNIFVGYYAASYRITESTMIVAGSVAASLLPMFSSFSKDESKMRELFLEYSRKIILISILFSVGISLFAYPIINILYSGKYADASLTLTILGFWIPFSSINMILTNLLISKEKQKLIPVIAAIILFFNVLANVILVRLYQSNGAALSAVLTEIVSFLIQLSLVKLLIKFTLRELFSKISLFFWLGVFVLLIVFQGSVPLVLSISLILILLGIYYFTGEISRKKITEIIAR